MELLMGKPDKKDDRPANEQMADLEGIVGDIRGRIEDIFNNQMRFLMEECARLSQAVKEKDVEIRKLRAINGRYESYLLNEEITPKMEATSTISFKTRKNLQTGILEDFLVTANQIAEKGIVKINRAETEEDFELARKEVWADLLNISRIFK